MSGSPPRSGWARPPATSPNRRHPPRPTESEPGHKPGFAALFRRSGCDESTLRGYTGIFRRTGDTPGDGVPRRRCAFSCVREFGREVLDIAPWLEPAVATPAALTADAAK